MYIKFRTILSDVSDRCPTYQICDGYAILTHGVETKSNQSCGSDIYILHVKHASDAGKKSFVGSKGPLNV